MPDGTERGDAPTGSDDARTDTTLTLPTLEPTGPYPTGPYPTDLDPDLDLDRGEEWPTGVVSRGVRLRIPTAILLALLIAAGAFWGGSAAERSSGSTATGGLAAITARLRAGAGAGGRSGASAFAGAFGGSPPAARGTVTVVAGQTLYVTTTSGAIVKVVLGPSATVTRNAAVPSGALRPGDTVVVTGVTAKSGTVTATSIQASAAGTSGAGGLGRGGGAASGKGPG